MKKKVKGVGLTDIIKILRISLLELRYCTAIVSTKRQ